MEKIQKRKTEHVSYGLIRAQRKTMALKVSEDGTVTVRIPYGVRRRKQTALWRPCGLDPEADRRM